MRRLPHSRRVVLSCLSVAPNHGYGVILWAAGISPDDPRLSIGTVYGAIDALESAGMIELHKEEFVCTPPRLASASVELEGAIEDSLRPADRRSVAREIVGLLVGAAIAWCTYLTTAHGVRADLGLVGLATVLRQGSARGPSTTLSSLWLRFGLLSQLQRGFESINRDELFRADATSL